MFSRDTYGLKILLHLFVRHMIWTSFARTAFGNGFSSLHHKSATGRTEFSRRLRLNRVFTLGVVGATVKNPELAPPFHHLTIFTNRTRDAGFLFRRFNWVFFDEFAFRVTVAGDELAEASLSFDELTLFAIGTVLSGLFWPLHFSSFNGACADTIGKTLARKESAVFAELDNH